MTILRAEEGRRAIDVESAIKGSFGERRGTLCIDNGRCTGMRTRNMVWRNPNKGAIYLDVTKIMKMAKNRKE